MKRPTRQIYDLIRTSPVRSELLGIDGVDVNTNEAKKLVNELKGTVFLSKVYAGRKTQVYLASGKLHFWIAGYTSESEDDDYPIPLEEVKGVNRRNGPAQVA